MANQNIRSCTATTTAITGNVKQLPPTLIDTGVFAGEAQQGNQAKIYLNSDGSRVTKIVLDLQVVGVRDTVVATETVTIDFENGTVRGSALNSGGVSLGKIDAGITIDGATNVPTIAYEKIQTVKRIFDDDNIKKVEKNVEKRCGKGPVSDQVLSDLEEEVLRDIGNRLLMVREANGLTQEAMVQTFQETAPQITGYSRWENGERKISAVFLRQLVEKWRVDLNWLIAGCPIDKPKLSPTAKAAIRELQKLLE